MGMYDEDKIAFAYNSESIIDKLEDENINCKLHTFKSYKVDKKVICMLLPVLDYIVNRISSDEFFKKLKYQLEKDLNVRVHYSSFEDPVNNSS